MNFISRLCSVQVLSSIFSASFRNHPRWTNRNPLKCVSSAEEQLNKIMAEPGKQMEKHNQLTDKVIETTSNQVESGLEYKMQGLDRQEMHKVKKGGKPMKSKVDMLGTLINEEGEFIYTKLKNKDPHLSQILANVKTKKNILTSNLILLEGKRLIRDALLAGCRLKYLLFTRKPDVEFLKPNLPKCGAMIYKMPYREMQMWSDLTTSPGIMGLFYTPNVENYVSEEQIPLSIYCDNVREPGNLGAILRVAASVGCQKVMLSPGCTYLWDTKVTRSSAGSHFHIQILLNKSIADLQLEINDSNCNKMLFIADNNVLYTEGTSKTNTELGALINQIPIIPYYGVNIQEPNKQQKEIVLVIGGETCGIHEEIYQLAKDFKGVRLNIPMSNSIDSLNTATAFGIIAFELYRQFITSLNFNRLKPFSVY